MEGNAFLTAKDVARVLQISESKAYVIIRNMNDELAAGGKMICRGRVPTHYFYSRFGIER